MVVAMMQVRPLIGQLTKRQLGSSFKPIVYLAALENGYSPV